MADTTVNANVNTSSGNRYAHPSGPAWISTLVGASVFIDGNNDVVAVRTTDGGATHSAVIAAEAGTAGSIESFFDRRIPGDNGVLLHVVWVDNVLTSFRYQAFNIETGAWVGSVVEIDGTASGAIGVSACFITKTRAGTFVAGWANGTGSGCFRSDDGATWNSTGNPYEAHAIDLAMGMHCATSNSRDARILFGDASATEMTAKTFDDTAGTWSESGSIMTCHLGVTGLACDVTTDPSDGSSVVVGWNEFDTATADLKVSRVPAGASPTPAALADAVSNSAESGVAGVFVFPDGTIWALFSSGTALHSLTTVKKAVSTDRGVSFGAPAAYSEAAEADVRVIRGGSVGLTQGGMAQPRWFENVANDLFVNLVNDSEAAGVAVAGGSGVATRRARARRSRWL